jgi:hypothetical protein
MPPRRSRGGRTGGKSSNTSASSTTQPASSPTNDIKEEVVAAKPLTTDHGRVIVQKICIRYQQVIDCSAQIWHVQLMILMMSLFIEPTIDAPNLPKAFVANVNLYGIAQVHVKQKIGNLVIDSSAPRLLH